MQPNKEIECVIYEQYFRLNLDIVSLFQTITLIVYAFNLCLI